MYLPLKKTHLKMYRWHSTRSFLAKCLRICSGLITQRHKRQPEKKVALSILHEKLFRIWLMKA